MASSSPVKIKDVFSHYTERTEAALGRGELLLIVAEGMSNSDPRTARILKTIADEIVAECLAALDDMNILSSASAEDLNSDLRNKLPNDIAYARGTTRSLL